MIQRIQSIFLLVSSILMGIFLTTPIARFITNNQENIILQASGFKNIANQNELLNATTPLLILCIIILLISLISIFLFKKRILQIRLCIYNILLNIGLIGLFVFYYLNFINNHDISEKMFTIFTPVPLANIILLILAFRGIRKDEVIVKAYDRLR